jgi:hypothetical protein
VANIDWIDIGAVRRRPVATLFIPISE